MNHVHILKVVSIAPPVFKRISLFTVVQLYLVNHPPTKIFPSFWIAKALIPGASNQFHILKETSIAPLVVRRTILFFIVDQLYVVNNPATKIFPSIWVIILWTAELHQFQTKKESSLVQSLFKRITLFAVAPL